MVWPVGGSVAGSWSHTVADSESVDHLGVVADKGGKEVGGHVSLTAHAGHYACKTPTNPPR